MNLPSHFGAAISRNSLDQWLGWRATRLLAGCRAVKLDGPRRFKLKIMKHQAGSSRSPIESAIVIIGRSSEPREVC